MFKKIMILMIALVCLLSVSCISASDTNTTGDGVVAVANAGTFQDLANDLSAGGNINLTRDYIQTDSYGQITINKNTNINGNGHTIDAKEKSRIFDIGSNVTVTLKNIRLINGKSTSLGNGGAITNSGDLIVDNCHFNNTISDDSGGAIYTRGSVTVNNSSFTNTTASSQGGAIYTQGGSVTVVNSSFTNNKANQYSGGAIYNYGGSVNVANSSFTNTTANTNGGAITSGSGSVTVVTNSTFNDNSAKNYGASIYTMDVLNVKDSTFNSQNANGTAIIYIESYNYDDVNLTNNTITSKLLPIYNKGGQIISPTTLTFQNVTVDEGENATLTATLKDDKGNIIGSNTPVNGNVNGTPVNFVFDTDTMNFTAVYNETTIKGKYTVTGNYSKATACNVINGTLTVGNTPDFKTLQDIIDAASPAGTVYLNGTNYAAKPGQQNVIINKTLTIIGGSEDDPSLRSILDANGQCRIFNITHGVIANLINLTFINGNATSEGGAIYTDGGLIVNNSQFINTTANLGGAIYANMTGGVFVYNSTFIDTTAEYGGAITGYNVRVTDSLFADTTAINDGGAIVGMNVIVGNSSFINTQANNSGAIYGLNVNVVNSIFTNTSADSIGGAIGGGNVNVTDSIFANTSAVDFGGAIAGGNVTVADSIFTNTLALDIGGAIAGGNIHVIGSDFINTTALNIAGAIAGDNVTVADSLFMDTTADYGGAICGAESFVNVTNSTFIDTTAFIDGGAIYGNTTVTVAVEDSIFMDSMAGNSGGAIYSNDDVIVFDSIFIDTVALTGNGGAIAGNNIAVVNSNFRNNTAKDKGGAIYSNNSASLLVTNSTFAETIADYGGAISGFDVAVVDSFFVNTTANNSSGAISGFNVTVFDSNFTNTSANDGSGGAISGFNVTVIGSNFIDTTADNGGAISGFDINVADSLFTDTYAEKDGGAIAGLNVIVAESIFTNTTANIDGGAIFGDNITVAASKFIDTSANNTGGAISGDSVLVVDSTFNDNIAEDGGAIYGNNNITVKDSLFTNTAAFKGGAIYADKGIVNVTNSSFMNTTVFVDGGAIYGNNNITVTDSHFIDSMAGESGGAIYTDGNVVVKDSLFLDTTAIKDNGGAISGNKIYVIDSNFLNTTANSGGAISGNDVGIANSNFINSAANNSGGAIFGNNIFAFNSTFIDTTAINGDGGAISGNEVLVMNSTFKNNTATGQYSKGGAISAYEGSAAIINSTFTDTKTTYRGGAIYTNPHNKHNSGLMVIGSTFTNTQADDNGGAIWGGSGEAKNFTFIVEDSTFTNTQSGTNGGAIYAPVTNGNFDVIGSTFNDNSAKGKGASIYAGGAMNLKDSTFNSSDVNGSAVVYINSNKDINLNNNTIESNLLAIYNNGGKITSPTTLTFPILTVEKGENATLSATLTDDNGNIIGSSTNVKGKVNGTSVTFKFNETTRNFTAVYTKTANEGKYPITGSYSKATDCDVNDGALYVGEVFEIDAPSIVKYYKNGTQFIVKLTENGRAIIGSQVEITINGATYKRTTDMNGTAKLNINLAPGEYDVNVTAIGSFGELTTNATVTVLSTIEGNDTVLYYRNGTKYNAIFLDEQGNPLNNTKVTFNINGVTYERTTNENGTTSGLNINLAPGEYVITATNSANGEMHSNIITVLPTIETENLVKYYKNGSQFVAKALDKQGQASAGQTVKFNINGVIYTKTTDDNGEAKLNINLAAGNNAPEIYIITTECNGCTVSNSVIVLPVILGEDMSIQYHSGEKYNVFVFDGQGELEEGVPITFNINGVTYHRTSNSEGTTSGLTINLQPGEYIITAIRDDNGATISNNIVVNA